MKRVNVYLPEELWNVYNNAMKAGPDFIASVYPLHQTIASQLVIFIKLWQRFVSVTATVLTGNRQKASLLLSSPNCLTKAKMTRAVNFQYCQAKTSEMPLAIARFTAYDDHEKLLAVEQVTYENDTNYFQTEVSSALECGVDVSVISCHPISSFKWLEKVVNS